MSPASGKWYTNLTNNNLSKFQIGGSANNKNIVIRKNDNVSDFIQLYATEDMLELGSQDDGVWKSIWKAALKSDLDLKPEYSTEYLNNESVSLKMHHDQNLLIVGHSMSAGNPNGYFVYLFCAGNATSNTGKAFKIAGDFELSYSWVDGLNVNIRAESSQWIQVSILCL